MIRGIGIDIIDIQFITNMISKFGTVFLKNHYTEKEIELCWNKKRKSSHSFAGRFAAKEAFVKASGVGGNFHFKEIEILNDERGRPVLNYRPSAASAGEKNDDTIHVSISHHEGYAVAVVVIE